MNIILENYLEYRYKIENYKNHKNNLDIAIKLIIIISIRIILILIIMFF